MHRCLVTKVLVKIVGVYSAKPEGSIWTAPRATTNRTDDLESPMTGQHATLEHTGSNQMAKIPFRDISFFNRDRKPMEMNNKCDSAHRK